MIQCERLWVPLKTSISAQNPGIQSCFIIRRKLTSGFICTEKFSVCTNGNSSVKECTDVYWAARVTDQSVGNEPPAKHPRATLEMVRWLDGHFNPHIWMHLCCNLKHCLYPATTHSSRCPATGCPNLSPQEIWHEQTFRTDFILYWCISPYVYYIRLYVHFRQRRLLGHHRTIYEGSLEIHFKPRRRSYSIQIVFYFNNYPSWDSKYQFWGLTDR